MVQIWRARKPPDLSLTREQTANSQCLASLLTPRLCDLCRMDDAIGNAAVMLYALSEKYKESGSCRLEASYAHQLGVDMIPLTVEEGYRPTGWLRLVSDPWSLLVLWPLIRC